MRLNQPITLFREAPFERPYTLQPYQKKQVDALFRYFEHGYEDRLTPNPIEGASHPYQRAIIQQPTGAGKSYEILETVVRALKLGYRVLANTHRDSILSQLTTHLGKVTQCVPPETFDPLETLDFVVRATSKKKLNPYRAPVQVASIDLICFDENNLERFASNWDKYYDCPTMIVIDEGHRLTARTLALFERYLDFSPNGIVSKVVAFTATPIRYSKPDLAAHYQVVIKGLRIDQLIAMGRLSKFKYFSINPGDINKLWRELTNKSSDQINSQKMSEYSQFLAGRGAGSLNMDDIPDEVNNLLMGDVVDTWYKYNPKGFKTVLFGMDISHCQGITDAFNKDPRHGRAITLSSRMPRSEILLELSRFVKGEYDIVANVGLFGEGFDLKTYAEGVLIDEWEQIEGDWDLLAILSGRSPLPERDQVPEIYHGIYDFYLALKDCWVGCVQLVCFTRSMREYLQRCGRALRVNPLEEFSVIIDMTGIKEQLGMFCDPYDWALKVPKKKRKQPIDEDLMEGYEDVVQGKFSGMSCTDSKVIEKDGALIRIPYESKLYLLEEKLQERRSHIAPSLEQMPSDRAMEFQGNVSLGAWMQWGRECSPSVWEFLFSVKEFDIPRSPEQAYTEWKMQGNQPSSIIQLKQIGKKLGKYGAWATNEARRNQWFQETQKPPERQEAELLSTRLVQGVGNLVG